MHAQVAEPSPGPHGILQTRARAWLLPGPTPDAPVLPYCLDRRPDRERSNQTFLRLET